MGRDTQGSLQELTYGKENPGSDVAHIGPPLQ
jgi:hypothetical protein